MGAWIEIKYTKGQLAATTVAPLVGAWIEIKVQSLVNRYLKSLPLWERGLKSGQILFNYEELSRSPCGSVD